MTTLLERYELKKAPAMTQVRQSSLVTVYENKARLTGTAIHQDNHRRPQDVTL